jgi:hypothetical protein
LMGTASSAFTLHTKFPICGEKQGAIKLSHELSFLSHCEEQVSPLPTKKSNSQRPNSRVALKTSLS